MLPTLEVTVGMLLVDVLVKIGFARSKREARHLIVSGAVSLSPVPEGLCKPSNPE